MWVTIATIDNAVYHTDRHAWLNLCLSQPAAWTTTTKRREQNLILRSGKSEAEVTNNRRLRSMYCTIEAKQQYWWQTRRIARHLCDSWAIFSSLVLCDRLVSFKHMLNISLSYHIIVLMYVCYKTTRCYDALRKNCVTSCFERKNVTLSQCLISTSKTRIYGIELKRFRALYL